MSRQQQKEYAARIYALLLKCYPPAYRESFGSQMLQTFKDHYSDVVEVEGMAASRFWLALIGDEVGSVLREHGALLKESISMKNPWIKQGLLFGILLGLVHITYNLINNLAPANVTLNNLLNGLFIPALLVFYGVAGYVAARRTGETTAGTRAGLLTGLLSVAIGMCTLFVITFAFMNVIRENAFMLYDFRRSGATSLDDFIIQDAIGAALIGTLFSLLAGGLLGTLGGFLGKTLKGNG